MNELLTGIAPPIPITDIKIFLQSNGKLRAFAAVVLADSFKINGLKVIEGKNGIFVAMPSRKSQDGTFQDIAHPINSHARAYLERRVLRAYWNEAGEEGAGPRPLLADDSAGIEGREGGEFTQSDIE
jgi:stage V sporulation protein G